MKRATYRRAAAGARSANCPSIAARRVLDGAREEYEMEQWEANHV